MWWWRWRLGPPHLLSTGSTLTHRARYGAWCWGSEDGGDIEADGEGDSGGGDSVALVSGGDDNKGGSGDSEDDGVTGGDDGLTDGDDS